MNNWTSILIWAAVIAAVFGYLWWQGQIQRLSAYVAETREELRKCSWPTWEELKGQTVLIAICVALMGVFTFVSDRVFQFIFYKLI